MRTVDARHSNQLGLRAAGGKHHAISIGRVALADLLLHLAFFVALYRATGMWFGYPSTQNENSAIDPAVMQYVLYSIVPILGAITTLMPQAILGMFKRIPPLLLAFGGLVLIASVLSREPGASLRGLVAVIVISMPVLFFRLRFGAEHTMVALRRFAAAAIVVNFLYIVAFPGYGIMGGSLAGSARGMFVHKNIFGQFAAVAFLILLPFPVQRPILRYSTLFYACAALLALVCVGLSLSSTALALIVIGLLMMAFSYFVIRVPSPPLRAYIFFVAIIVGGIAAYGIGVSLLEIFAANVGKDATFSGRTEVWEALMRPIAERPIFGHGFALFRQPDYIASYTSQIPWGPRSTHNTYIEIALNLGLPAALLWSCFLLTRLTGKFVRRVRSVELRNLRVKEVAIMSAIAVGAFTEAGVMLAPVITWAVLLAVMPSSSGTRRENKNPNTLHFDPQYTIRYGLMRR